MLHLLSYVSSSGHIQKFYVAVLFGGVKHTFLKDINLQNGLVDSDSLLFFQILDAVLIHSLSLSICVSFSLSLAPTCDPYFTKCIKLGSFLPILFSFTREIIIILYLDLAILHLLTTKHAEILYVPPLSFLKTLTVKDRYTECTETPRLTISDITM